MAKKWLINPSGKLTVKAKILTLIGLFVSVNLAAIIYYEAPKIDFDTSDINPLKGGPVLEKGSTGGFCGHKICQGVIFTIYEDGSAKGIKNLNRFEVKKLKRLIKDIDFDLYKSGHGDCPSAYDGRDIYYTFPQKSEERFYLCHHAIPADDPLFSFLGKISNSNG